MRAEAVKSSRVEIFLSYLQFPDRKVDIKKLHNT